MKKLNLILLTIFFAFIVIQTACTKDDPAPVTNNITNNNPANPAKPPTDYSLDTSVRLNYTVLLVSGTNFSVGYGKASDNHVADAKVTVTQNGVKQELTTDQSGMANFTGFFKGVLAVSITKDDMTAIKYLVTVNAAVGNANAGKVDVANIIPIFRTKNDALTAQLIGRVTYQNDLTNSTREIVPAGTKIVASIDAANPGFYDQYLKIKNPYILDSLQSGKILNFAYEAAFYDSTDALGNYAITIPGSIDGLPFKLNAPDMVSNQKYYENASVAGFNQSKTVRTLYSSAQFPSVIPPAGGALVTFLSGSGAFASASVSGSGQLDKININSGGTGYTSAPKVIINGGGGNGATANAVITNGVVTAINITNAGSGYTSDPTVSIISGSGANINATIGGGGSVLSIQVISSGSGYTTAPTITIGAPTLTGGVNATATAVINATTGAVTSITITNAGSGYISNPTITIAAAPSGGTNASASVIYSGQSVTSFVITNGGTNYTGNPAVTFSLPDLASGTRAQGIATVDVNTGVITGFTITNPGSGYTFAPSVSLNAGSGASATAMFSGRGLTGISIINGGNDYYSAPTVKITGGGGNGAVANALISNGKVVGFTITNSGIGYTSSPNIELISGSGAQASVTVTNGEISSINIVNGGSKYTGAPKVVITSNPTNGPGAGATAVAIVDANGSISGITITDKGTGYLGGNVPSIAEPFSITPAAGIFVISGGTYVRDIHLGTGFRIGE